MDIRLRRHGVGAFSGVPFFLPETGQEVLFGTHHNWHNNSLLGTISPNASKRGSIDVIDAKNIGYQGMAAFLIEASPSHILATDGTIDSSLILGRLIQMPNIIWATKTVSDYDLLAVGVAMDSEHLFDIGSDIARMPGVKNLEVSFWVEKKGLCPKYFIV